MKKLCFILFFLGFFYKNCLADVYFSNDTTDQDSQKYLVGVNYKVCGSTNENTIIPICITPLIRSMKIHANSIIEEGAVIPTGYQAVVYSITVFNPDGSEFYTKTVQKNPSPNMCVNRGDSVSVGAFVGDKMVICNDFSY